MILFHINIDGIHWLLKDFPPMEINSYRQLFG